MTAPQKHSGLFYCYYRKDFFSWNEYITYYENSDKELVLDSERTYTKQQQYLTELNSDGD
ncbi:MAG TPA: hypothetical protein EYF95_07070 [Flavobacteriales bacterium]|nr:hypothetical protein [Flavobacteriales bacterium]